MATVTMVVVDRSGPAILAALKEFAPPEDVDQFETELRQALTEAAADLDMARAEAVLRRWHALATMAANPLTPEEKAMLERAKAGDLTGFRAQDEHGNWVTL